MKPTEKGRDKADPEGVEQDMAEAVSRSDTEVPCSLSCIESTPAEAGCKEEPAEAG